MTDHISTIPPFKVSNIEFRCWVTDDGLNELGIRATRFEWRAHDGKIKCGRHEGSGLCWAMVHGKRVGNGYPSLKAAMLAGLNAYADRRAA